MIPPFIQQLIGLGVRATILWLAAKFGATLSDDAVMKIVAQVVPVVLVLVWSGWQKFASERKTQTAQNMRAGVTQVQVDKEIAAGDGPSISSVIFTAKNEQPS